MEGSGLVSQHTPPLTHRLDPHHPSTDANVHALYGAQLSRYYAHHGVKAHLMVLPGEEANKRQEAVTEVGGGVWWFGRGIGAIVPCRGFGVASPVRWCWAQAGLEEFLWPSGCAHQHLKVEPTPYPRHGSIPSSRSL